MSSLARTVRARRTKLGLSQVEVATEAGVSLATVQKVEAGSANPSLSTLRSLLTPLGLTIGFEPEQADWDLLIGLGLPLTSATDREVRPDAETLARQVRLAALEVAGDPEHPDRNRRRDGLSALLLALRRHYPSFTRRLTRSPAVRRRVDDPPSGRIVKLARIALQRVAEYL